MRIFLLLAVLLASPLVSATTVVVTVEPLAKLLKGLYGDSVTVTTLLQPNQNPHHLSLSPRQALAVRQADLLVWLGAEVEAPLAPLVARRQGASVAMLDVPGLQRRYAEHAHEHEDDAGHGGAHHDHHHGEDGHDSDNRNNSNSLDPHLWLSPANMAALAALVATVLPDGLAAGEPEQTLAALAHWPVENQTRLAAVASQPWLSYHQPWGYLSDTLALQEPLVVTTQLEAGPGSRHFVRLAEQLREQQVQCGLQEPEARAGLLRRLCPQCQLLELDPLGRDQPQLTYLPWLDYLVDGFARCLGLAEGETVEVTETP